MKTISMCLTMACMAVVCACSDADRIHAKRLSDSDIEQAIKNRISADASLKRDDVTVDAEADKQTLTLKGTVHSQDARSRVIEMARAVEPGFTIMDKIDVFRDDYSEDMVKDARDSTRKKGEKVGTSLEDAWLHTKVKSQLAANNSTDAGRIDVDVEDRVVTLRGEVQSATARKEAGQVAAATDGVRRVNNQLTIKSI